MFMSVLKVDTTQVVNLGLLISNLYIIKIAQGRNTASKKILSWDNMALYLKKKKKYIYIYVLTCTRAAFQYLI